MSEAPADTPEYADVAASCAGRLWPPAGDHVHLLTCRVGLTGTAEDEHDGSEVVEAAKHHRGAWLVREEPQHMTQSVHK